jgi:hypothetical protein
MASLTTWWEYLRFKGSPSNLSIRKLIVGPSRPINWACDTWFGHDTSGGVEGERHQYKSSDKAWNDVDRESELYLSKRWSRGDLHGTRAHQHTSTRAHEHTSTRAHEHTSTSARQHTSTRAHEHTSTRAHEHTSTLTHLHTAQSTKHDA